MFKTPAPSELTEEPDSYTKEHPGFIKGNAPNQVLHLRLLGVSYGTDDKSHAAAIILSIVLFGFWAVTVAIGFFVEEPNWFEGLIASQLSAFLFVAGVAIGQSGGD